jgi:DNA helicase-2/ATP-dependent DNA helicase PcrA
MEEFKKSYLRLNAAQKEAVDNIDGPVLVVAGPGTGKTQLLTTRVANIMANTDTDPGQILCLTFTESGATNMKNRLNNLIGKESYKVNINTYHGFGNELIRDYHQYFPNYKVTRPADQLTLDKILRSILNDLPYSNPLKNEVFIRSIKKVISNAKRESLTPDNLLEKANKNINYLKALQPVIDINLLTFDRMSKKTAPLFESILKDILTIKTENTELNSLIVGELESSIREFTSDKSTKALTVWKSKWLEKNNDNTFVLKGIEQNQKIVSLADIYSSYERELQKHGIYDYDDMINLTIGALEHNDDFRYNIQEKYQYLLLDEFQDTNGSQFRLIELLTNNPVFENRPNVMAVGDDDQAIFSFQGANYSHMVKFYKLYTDVLVITLNQNYRSTPSVVSLAKSISGQIQERLNLPGMDTKNLDANIRDITDSVVRYDFNNELNQLAFIADDIRKRLDAGVSAKDIAIIGRKHAQLMPIVPYLHKKNIKLRYDKRDNILDDPRISTLISMSRLVLALKKSRRSELNELWPEVLSADFFNIPTSLIWEISWDANDNRKLWKDLLIANEQTKNICLFFYRLSLISEDETLETMLDYLIGINELDLHESEGTKMKSKFYDFYFKDHNLETTTTEFWTLLQNLTALRQYLREYSSNQDSSLKLKDFTAFIEENVKSEIKLINNSPIIESDDSVYISSAHSVKGLEFDTVYIIDALESVWGSKSKDQSDKITAPPTMEALRSIGIVEDERIRLFYVAATRAKKNLVITSYDKTSNNRDTLKLKYLAEYEDDNQNIISPYLSERNKLVISPSVKTPTIEESISYWQARHIEGMKDVKLKDMLSDRLTNFKLSPTNLNKFTNVEREGPEAFFLDSLLRFPKAKAAIAEYGTAVHRSLEWFYKDMDSEKIKPTLERLLLIFDEQLDSKDIAEQEKELLKKRGIEALKIYYEQAELDNANMVLPEVPFANENVHLDDAHIAGNIDKVIIDPRKRTATIVDYKTGKSYQKWKSETKLHNYERQLYFYKLLLENSRTYKRYKVTDAYLEFVEPDKNGKINKLHIVFDENKLEETNLLIKSIYKRIVELDFPDISKYPKTLTGIKAFEQDLIKDIKK